MVADGPRGWWLLMALACRIFEGLSGLQMCTALWHLPASDLWTCQLPARRPWCSCLLQYECCTGHYPFDAQNEGALIRKILRGQYQPITGPYSSALVQVRGEQGVRAAALAQPWCRCRGKQGVRGQLHSSTLVQVQGGSRA